MKVKAIVLAAGLVIGLLGSACSSTGPYPRDFFIEMHYQRSYRSQEPPRLQPAPLAVPVTGREVALGSFQEAADLSNPVPLNPQTMGKGASLYQVNCAMCHGAGGRGDSFVAGEFRAAGVAPPADLASPPVKALSPGQLYWMVTKGLGNMPAFSKLLSSDERWTLVHYVRAINGG